MSSEIAIHAAPVWIRKANFLIRADLSRDEMPGRSEQLWARQRDEMAFEVCCLPFFTHGICLGDIVQTDGRYHVCKILEKSGHRLLRIAVAVKTLRPTVSSVLQAFLAEHGYLHEVYCPGYLAVDLYGVKREEPIVELIGQWVAGDEVQYEIID